MMLSRRMNGINSINTMDLMIALLQELERQHPGATITKQQYDVMTQACNAILDAVCGNTAVHFIETQVKK